jgi:hypothetical protein
MSDWLHNLPVLLIAANDRPLHRSNLDRAGPASANHAGRAGEPVTRQGHGAGITVIVHCQISLQGPVIGTPTKPAASLPWLSAG